MYQKFVHESVVLRRILCACLVLIMALSMLPMAAPRAAAAMDGQTLYFKPNNWWYKDNAWFAAYFYGNGEKWVKMTDSNNDGIFECKIPNGFTNVIFVRKNPSNTGLDWDGKWGQTGDLTLGKGNYYVQKNDQNAGGDDAWENYSSGGGETAVDYYLMGFINGADYNDTGYKFNNGSLTVTFTEESYVFVKDSENVEYLTEDWLGENVTSATLYSSAAKPDKMYVPAGTVTFTLVKNANGTLTLSYTTSGSTTPSEPPQSGTVGDVVDINVGSYSEDKNKLYINTTFYDYYSDWEMLGKNLDDRGGFNKGFDDWYIFDDFNQALSRYYTANSAKVPIYAGHFQPEWEENGQKWGWPFAEHGQALYGYKDNQAWGVKTQDQKYFMSVNNSNMNLTPELGYVNAAAWGIVADTLDGNKNLQAVKNNGTSKFIMPFFDEDFLLNGDKKLGDTAVI